ncbi:hypothetical protein MJO28_003727 [Puccinia striiformis f. sp. tritici]|uniref:Uncharacterized protein n=3 Tax=Puccinia striiformis TaxID=27350 RepID=A0A2S4VAJ9_9BASI|nr:hypothetical protein MJO29_016706 [Puccinia striiformis f. sp. tritici]KAI7956632.1 hypothetical protein MJO28_003727 [Puccinia striiformis f. sp. tritici]KAI7964178.1 hypothetical protein MJO29_004605 [Puccinia striiformis f. sp. tritici]POW06559.1 hypothetical protein PSHT_10279 [Puccinia striiformis]POW10811.1 hypothetical protein PSTT_05804 [Puccinia striiformis]
MISTSNQTTYFSFPTYESHFGSAIEAQKPIPVVATPFHEALQPLVDVATEAYPIIQRNSNREAQIELFNILAARPSSRSSSYQTPDPSPVSSCPLTHTPHQPIRDDGNSLGKSKTATKINLPLTLSGTGCQLPWRPGTIYSLPTSSDPSSAASIGGYDIDQGLQTNLAPKNLNLKAHTALSLLRNLKRNDPNCYAPHQQEMEKSIREDWSRRFAQ